MSYVHCIDCNITNAQYSLIAKSLKFVPRLSSLPIPNWRENIGRFNRNVRIFGFFNGRGTMPNYITKYRGVLARSLWLPPSADIPPQFTHFLKLANRSLFQFRPQHTSLNLDKEHRAALEELQTANLVVCPADKGSTAVVLPSATYSNLVSEHLADVNTYEQVTEVPDTQQLFLDALGEDLHHLHPRVQRRLRQPGERVPNFYGLPKLHKTPLKIRPIVSSVDSQTYYWAKWVHAELWPAVRTNPHMLVNSADLAVRLADVNWEADHMCFLNLDVVSLYTSIDHGQGIQAMMTFLRGDHVHPTLPDYPGRDWMSIVRVMCLILTCNYFTWDGTLYHQLRGTAMGSPAAVVYANIFMFQVEKSHLSNLIASSKLFVRFIDDLLFIMDDLAPATRVAANLNASNRPPRVRWTSSVSRARCVMLDLAITPDNDRLTTRLHFKKTNKFAYVDPSSSHPNHTWSAVAIGEMTRADRAASTVVARRSTRAFLIDRLQRRGYSKAVLNQALRHRKQPASSVHRPNPLVLPYHPSLIVLSRKLKKLWAEAGLAGQYPPPFIAWRRGNPLSALLPNHKHFSSGPRQNQ